jgi:benzoyl-CoA reductase/2-hydroxyglutaryl-CoA dehydratase subunit BcrC/BadD/HgdB
MEYLDFVLSEVHGLRIKEIQEAKAQGRKVIGTFCVFVPEELVLAADAVCVGLCAGAEIGKEAAEKILPRNTCALIKSFVGFKLSRLYPYIESCDLVDESGDTLEEMLDALVDRYRPIAPVSHLTRSGFTTWLPWRRNSKPKE